ncbi:MAG: ATP-binding cassette domain-containing protein [Myxococcales bacterium]|nr:ATP-binding cassette domain-containing protein [Myxococcales bacterium]
MLATMLANTPGTMASAPPTPLVPARATLEAEALVKRVPDGRGRRTVVDGVSLRVDRGELLVLQGQSGSGKTTLLAMLGAMLAPTSGEVRIDGVATSRLRDAHKSEVRRRNVGFVFQDAQLLRGLSVRANVLLSCVPDGESRADRERAEALLARFELTPLVGAKAAVRSGGEAARVAMCRALVRDPAIVLLDEPTAHLDEGASRRLAEDLATLTEEGRAIVVATHDPRLVDGLTRTVPRARVRVESLQNGRLTGDA